MPEESISFHSGNDLGGAHAEVRERPEQRRVVRPPRNLGQLPDRYRAQRQPIPRTKPLKAFDDIIRDISQVKGSHDTE